MKTIRARRQGALAAAPPPLGVRGQHRKGKADAGETVRVDAPTAASSPGPRSARLADPRARLELRRGRAHRRGLLRAPHRAALAVRARLPVASDAMRLVHGEADGLPGLIVDRYADTLSAQFLSAGAERWKA
jgi:23S rRNA (cytosine1962-C5)-methyltransferase